MIVASILLCAVLLVVLLRKPKPRVVAATNRDLKDASFHVARYERALQNPKPGKRRELEERLEFWRAVESAGRS